MNKVVVACNDNPIVPLHDFFEFSSDLIVEKCEDLGCDVVRIGTSNLTLGDLEKNAVNSELFCVASHGNADSIEDGYRQDLISKQTKADFLRNKVLYAIACSCGKNLAKHLLNAGLKAFIGYNDELVVQEGYAQFAKTAVQGAIGLLEGHSLSEAIKLMNVKYDECFAELDKIDPKVAAILLDNQEHLVCFGDPNFKLS